MHKVRRVFHHQVNSGSRNAASEMGMPALLSSQDTVNCEDQPTIKWLMRYWNTLKYVSPRTLARRLYREAVTLYVLKRGLICKAPASTCDVTRAVEKLVDRDFLAAARKQRQIVRSAFTLQQSTGRLTLWKTGEIIDEEFIERANWNRPERIPPSEADACYFAVF
jgi:hypothetical protein